MGNTIFEKLEEDENEEKEGQEEEHSSNILALASLVNTCYLNVAFQALSHTPNFVIHLLKHLEHFPKKSVAYKITILLQSTDTWVYPMGLRYACLNDIYLEKYSLLQEHDALEFFINLCKSLHQSLLQIQDYQYSCPEIEAKLSLKMAFGVQWYFNQNKRYEKPKNLNNLTSSSSETALVFPSPLSLDPIQLKQLAQQTQLKFWQVYICFLFFIIY